jgi:hypothetical protein
MRSSLREHVTPVENDDPLAQGEDLFPTVRDVEDRDAMGFVPGAQVVENAGFRGRIEGGQRLVKQQDAGIGDERTSERDALTFAAGDFARASIAQIADMEGFEDGSDAALAVTGGKAVESVGNVAGDGEVRKQREVLEDIADITFSDREIEALGVEE